ncbi:MAG: flagellar motor switch protein FliM [Pseudomonadota bacterium]
MSGVDEESTSDDLPDVDGSLDDSQGESSADDVFMDSADSLLDDDALQQDEIDELFGVSEEDDKPSAGIEALLNSRHIQHKSLPLLDACFDRLVHGLTKGLRRTLSEDVELSLASSSTVRLGNYIEGVSLPALISVFKAVEWNDFGLINIDSSLIYAIIDLLMGGRRVASAHAVEKWSFTSIETALIKRMKYLILDEMITAFKPLADVEFCLERMESNPSFAEIASPTSLTILVEIEVHMNDRGGRIEILIPYATLEPVRDQLEQMFMGEKFGQDKIWESHLAGQMLMTEAELEVTFGEQMMPLGEILSLQVGSTLKLRQKPQDMVTLRCSHTPLLRANVGRVGDNMAIKIAEWCRNRRGNAQANAGEQG